MKILHAATIRSDRPTGVSTYVRELLRALVAEGSLQVGLLPSLPDADPLGQAAIAGCILLDPPARRHFNPWHISSSWLDRIERAFGRPDLVNFHGVYNPFHCALSRLMRRRGWKYALSSHGGLQEQAQQHKRLKKALGNRLFFNAHVRHAAAVFATSRVEKSGIETRYPGVRTFVHMNGVPEDFLARAAALAPRSPRAGRAFCVGFLGRLEIHAKGLDILLRAAALLENDDPDLNVHFTLVGPEHRPADARTLTALYSALRKPERMTFAGPKYGDEKIAALSSFDVFIHTSRYEGMPAAILEAMGVGTPCILTPGTNLQFIAAEHGGGWACAATPESVAAAVREAARADPAELVRRGSRARRYVTERMTWAAQARSYARDIGELLG